jgi:glycosyltransferase involved in cell wall biosynthesis
MPSRLRRAKENPSFGLAVRSIARSSSLAYYLRDRSNPASEIQAMTSRVGVFHPGTQHSWQTALAFQESGNLAWYATSAFYDPNRWPYKLEKLVPEPLSARLHREFTRRHLPALESSNIRQFGMWEWSETGARRIGQDKLARWANRCGNRSFAKLATNLVEREEVDTLWGYNTSSLDVFRWAKRRNIRCVLDQTIGHCASLDRVMLAEREKNPDFFLKSFSPFSEGDFALQNEEVALADLVVAGCDFCAQTLVENGCDRNKIAVVPYGFDETLFPTIQPRRKPLDGRPVEFLFVGSVGPRKGIATLLQAFADIPGDVARLTIVGRLEIPEKTFHPFRDRVTHIGSLPRKDVVQHFVSADCFIFPSLFEGGGIVLYEAVAAGLGIIQSANCGDGVREGRNGLVLEEVSADCLRKAIIDVVANPGRLREWQDESWRIREERTWKRYRQSIRELVVA